jgi:tetratricopeptide (TPR) repeat protein
MKILTVIKNARFKRSIKSASQASKNKNWGNAAFHYQAALNRKPGLSWVWVQRGHALKENGALQQAADSYKRAVELNPQDEETCYHMADLYRRLNRPADVKAALKLALSIQKQGSDQGERASYIVINRAKAEAAISGATTSVIEKLAEVTTLYPSPENFVHFGHFLKEAGRHSEAEQCYRRAIALSSDDSDAYLHLGHALKLQDRIREALYAYRVAFNLSKDKNEHVRRNAKDELMNLGAKAERELTLPRGLSQAADATSWEKLIQNGELAELNDRLLRLAKDRRPPEVIDFNAQILLMIGSSRQAYEMLEELEANGLASERTYLIMAENSEVTGDLQAARELYGKALSTCPRYGEAFEALIRLNVSDEIYRIAEPVAFAKEIVSPTPGQTIIAAGGRSPGMALPTDFARSLRAEMVARGMEMKAKGYVAQSRLFLEDADLIGHE